ncbi:PREDICTED: GTPase-activating protein-like isoform X2 [Amphimedon queenslandica]|uniref:Ras-GAP domain-containing protein n=1 Tax=Amphimedon queenslandica TaxID=400682 RepID=A0A1X7V5D8_AMPQE|nr:PREDICTED: GTPase-activating protein-like isoform X2 [Amphimedon queenslandica]|eukprot:XP_019850644.1 PREDICTED: GTPase-activating protein-like isoform X2 [Amphimedon queenslandica]
MATNSNTTSTNNQLLLSTQQGPVMANNPSSSSLDMATPRHSLKDGRAKIIMMNSENTEEANSGSSSQVEEQPTANGEIEDDEGEEGYSEPVVVKTVRSTSLDVSGHFLAQEQDEYQIYQAELRKIKDQITQMSKKNYKLEKDLKFFDSKIALLITHKISIEEVESQLSDSYPHSTIMFKGIHSPEIYGELFLILQTSPEYIAKLARSVSQKEIDGLLQIVMFSLYGNQYEDREEHLLLSMFEYALTYEVQEATEINSLMRANTAITRMMTTYCRRGPGQEYVRTALESVIEELAAYDGSLEIDPLKIYQRMVEDGEVERVDESTSVRLAEAESNATVHKRIQERAPVLERFVMKILELLKESISRVPYGIRWLCKATKLLVQEKFTSASSETINSFIGGFFILRYVNPIIATPHAYQLLSQIPSQQTRRNLTLVAKLIQKLANTSSVRESYMLPLEHFVKTHNERLKMFLSDLCEVSDFHEQLQLEEYIAVSRKDIAIEISPSEIATLHNLLVKYKAEILASHNDKLGVVLTKLDLPSEEMEKGQQPFRLKLSQRLTDPGVPSRSPLVLSSGVSMNVADQLASARRKCKHLLIHLFKMCPSCMNESTISDALKVAILSPIEEVRMHAEVISEQLKTIDELGGFNQGGKDLYDEIRAILPSRKVLLEKSQGELTSLRGVQETIAEHSEFLEEQLEAYREYLDAVRAKVAEGQLPQPGMFRKQRGVYKFSHSQLEKAGVIVESPGIPVQRRGTMYYAIFCVEPGIYSITVHQKGNDKAIYEKKLCLEDLLEQQRLQDPVIDMEGLVLLNARRTLMMLSRCFMKKDNPRPVSRHLSAPAIHVHSKS